MADLLPIIEAMEHRWMRAWVARDVRTLRAVTSRQFTMLVGSKPAVILDARSWLDAASTRYLCSAYRFGDVYVRDWGRTALFASNVEVEASLDGHDWSGQLWITDVWRKSHVRRQWRMLERIVSRPDLDPDVSAGIKALQLWR